MGKDSKPHEDLHQCQFAGFFVGPEINQFVPTHRIGPTGVQVDLEAVTTRNDLVRAKATVCPRTSLPPEQSIRTPTLQPAARADHSSPQDRESAWAVKNLLRNARLRFCVILHVDFAFVLAIVPIPLLFFLGLKSTLAQGTLTASQMPSQTVRSFDARAQSALRSAS